MSKEKKNKKPKNDLRDVFGTLKTHVSAQKFKDMCREGWSA